jgi:predicted MFS family arabinose efflux permease
LSGSAGRIALSAISDRIADGKRRLVTLCLGTTPVALIAAASLPAHSAAWIVVTFSALLGVCCFGWYGPWVVWLSDSAADGQVGEVLGAAMAINQIAIASVPAIFGFVSDVVPAPALPWYGISSLLGLAFAWTLRASSKARGASSAGSGTDSRNARKYQPFR